MTDTDLRPKPLFLTFVELSSVTWSLHMGDRRYLSTLHDVWLCGAPHPRAIIRDARNNDPRKTVAGNHEERLILPTKFCTWVMDVSAARGHPYSMRQAMAMLHGQIDYGLDQVEP